MHAHSPTYPFDCYVCRSNLKSIKPTLAIGACYALCIWKVIYHRVLVYTLLYVVSIGCKQNNKSVLSIYTNVIYIAVWPTHLIENCHIASRALVVCRANLIIIYMLESDASRHPIIMHRKQLLAIRLNYCKFEAWALFINGWHAMEMHTLFPNIGQLYTNKRNQPWANMETIQCKHQAVSHLFCCLKLRYTTRKSIVLPFASTECVCVCVIGSWFVG